MDGHRPATLGPLLGLLAACQAQKPASEASSDTAACAPVDGDPTLDAWGGDARVSGAATGWFTLTTLCDRAWFLDPDGHPMQSIGVNATTSSGSQGQDSGTYAYAEAVAAAYDSQEAWADATADRLRAWGFNTAGAWSDADLLGARLAQTPILYLSGNDWEAGSVGDVYDPAWEEAVSAIVASEVAPHADDPQIIGWFLDNEMRWGPDWRGADTLLQLYLEKGAEAPGKAAAVAALVDHYGGAAATGAALGLPDATTDDLLARTDGWSALDAGSSDDEAALTTAFLSATADRYFSTTTAAIRAADAHHPVLGNREVSVLTRAEVYEAAAPYLDVISINAYVFLDGVGTAAMNISGALDPSDGFAALHDLVTQPILITEFGFRADDSGLPNSWPPIYPTYDTQQDRADAFQAYAEAAQAVPWIVGYHWFEWVDEPAEGRFDGEDDNWGLVNEADQPYTELTDRMTTVNGEIWDSLMQPTGS